MKNLSEPMVSVVTPVYNGGKYLRDCIDSVRNQQYENWEYIIVNNCSKDMSLDIALRYSDIDPRIRVMNNRTFVDVIENHEIAVRFISSKSKYCKVVSADDWITPDCLRKMVNVAETHPTIGIVGSYQRSGEGIRWKGLPDDVQVISGREVCRSSFLDGLDVFGNPTTSLYRSDLIRNNDPFFPHTHPYADTSVCYEYLQQSDFGFVHEILSTARIHSQQLSPRAKMLGMGTVGSIHHLLEYGPVYLTGKEFETCKNEIFNRYYRFLGGCILKMREREFWKYQISRLRDLGYPIPWRKVIKGMLNEVTEEIQNPKVAFNKFIMILKNK